MSFRVATYNAGLAVGLLPYATERAERVVTALSALEVDLLFVQEFWLDSHWEFLRRALAPRLPYDARPSPILKRTAACQAEQLRPLVECASRWCAGRRDEDLARCVVEHCAPTALTLPTPCLNCIASHPEGTLEEIVGRCVGNSADSVSAGLGSSRYGGLIAYGGSFGTGLIARTPLLDVDQLVFESSVNARGAIYARLGVPAFGELAVIATHLSPGGAEHPPQVHRLLSWLADKAPNGPAILLGDLNMTPANPLFRLLESAGFSAPPPPHGFATYTPNGLGTGEAPTAGIQLDHILLREIDAPAAARRVLDQPIHLSVGEQTVLTTLSDHFGVLVEFDS
ncbi:MAG TPA: endonuclease/exonuclease/phosphatase family protein [Polyangiaceae bacterium]|nr:endonuclease/exonuclease/phosphatase family protein [Polyangiaceae bacterium]